MRRDLSDVPEAELRAELSQREQQRRGSSGANYYFIEDDEYSADDSDEKDWMPLLIIVHRRFWHRHHAGYDQHIASYVVLPSGFDEVQESRFKFEGSFEDAKAQLRSYGFVELDPKRAWDESFFVTFITVAGQSGVRIDWCCDMPELLTLMKQHKQDRQEFESLVEYQSWVRSLATGLSAEVMREYGGGAEMCLMTEETARDLPQYPAWLEE